MTTKKSIAVSKRCKGIKRCKWTKEVLAQIPGKSCYDTGPFSWWKPAELMSSEVTRVKYCRIYHLNFSHLGMRWSNRLWPFPLSSNFCDSTITFKNAILLPVSLQTSILLFFFFSFHQKKGDVCRNTTWCYFDESKQIFQGHISPLFCGKSPVVLYGRLALKSYCYVRSVSTLQRPQWYPCSTLRVAFFQFFKATLWLYRK